MSACGSVVGFMLLVFLHRYFNYILKVIYYVLSAAVQ